MRPVGPHDITITTGLRGGRAAAPGGPRAGG